MRVPVIYVQEYIQFSEALHGISSFEANKAQPQLLSGIEPILLYGVFEVILENLKKFLVA